MGNLKFYKDAKRNSERMIKRGLMTLGKPDPAIPKLTKQELRRERERVRIAAARRRDKLK